MPGVSLSGVNITKFLRHLFSQKAPLQFFICVATVAEC